MPLVNIVLNKDNDLSGGGSDDCCPFAFGSIMGQEDLFTETSAGSETRDLNTLQARIVWATTVDASSRVYYGADPLLDQDTGIVATGNKFHEVLIPNLNIGTLYRFEVESTSTVCNAGGETLRSEVFWFQIGDELTLESQTLVFNVASSVLTPVAASTSSYDWLDAEPDTTGTAATVNTPLGITEAISTPTENAINKTAGSTMLTTSVSTAVA